MKSKTYKEGKLYTTVVRTILVRGREMKIYQFRNL